MLHSVFRISTYSNMNCIGVIFFYLLFYIQYSMTISIGSFDSNRLVSLFLPDSNGFRPDLLQISIKKLKNDEDTNKLDNNEEDRQIPVISDIERIKKVIEIIEFVGEKVGDLIDKIQVPTTDPNEQIYESRSTEINTTSL